MTMNTEALPWRLGPFCTKERAFIIDAQDCFVADFKGLGALDQATTIIEAVNAHDTLLAERDRLIQENEQLRREFERKR